MAASIALAIGGALLGTHPHGTVWSLLTVPVTIASAACLVSLPFVMNRWILSGEPGLAWFDYITATIATIAFWTCMSFAFLSFVSAFPHADIGNDYINVVGAYLFAWAIGFITVFAPQGIGVFEVVAADLLPAALSFQALAAILAGFRLVSLLGDLSLWLIWFFKNFMRPA
ncbi:MAG TPA: hypothetical protein PLN31_11175 [Azoarcus taiwanensis]|nr:hypothetical protein [Azoarcus taiwanensis]